jgi:hypothetical protein
VAVVKTMELGLVLGQPVVPYPLIINTPLNFETLAALCNRMGPGVSALFLVDIPYFKNW